MTDTELTDAEVDYLLERFDQTDPALQRRVIAAFVQQSVQWKQYAVYLQTCIACGNNEPLKFKEFIERMKIEARTKSS